MIKINGFVSIVLVLALSVTVNAAECFIGLEQEVWETRELVLNVTKNDTGIVYVTKINNVIKVGLEETKFVRTQIYGNELIFELTDEFSNLANQDVESYSTKMKIQCPEEFKYLSLVLQIVEKDDEEGNNNGTEYRFEIDSKSIYTVKLLN